MVAWPALSWCLRRDGGPASDGMGMVRSRGTHRTNGQLRAARDSRFVIRDSQDMAKPGVRSVTATAPRVWWLYLLLCSDGRTYAGVTLDVESRFAVHIAGKGARFTRANRPIRVLATQAFASKSDAFKAEHELKKL